MTPRSRMISIRLTEDEFNTLRQLCELTGARSVSDLARDALHSLVNGENPPPARQSAGMLESRVKALDIRVNALGRTVEKLGAIFTATAGGRR